MNSTKEKHSCTIGSTLFFHTPSLTAKEAFFSPVSIGVMHYEPDYFLSRDTYDNILLLYIQSGTLTVKLEDKTFSATENQFILFDCRQPHSYYPSGGCCDLLFIHISGKTIDTYYQMIHARQGYVFSLQYPGSVLNLMNILYSIFANQEPIVEIVISKYITDILTLLATQVKLSPTSAHNDRAIKKAVSYINSHINETISLNDLAEHVSLSPYHFLRIFKTEIGFTPHEYIISTKINAAKFMLRNTTNTIKHICFECGFSSESAFSSTFKKYVGISPNQYRSSGDNN